MVCLGVAKCVIGPGLGCTGLRCDAVSASLGDALDVSNGSLDLKTRNNMKLHAIIERWAHLITEHVSDVDRKERPEYQTWDSGPSPHTARRTQSH
jgi:hypothetical protein